MTGKLVEYEDLECEALRYSFFEGYCRIERIQNHKVGTNSFGIQNWSEPRANTVSTQPCSSQDRALAKVAPVKGDQHASACSSR